MLPTSEPSASDKRTSFGGMFSSGKSGGDVLPTHEPARGGGAPQQQPSPHAPGGQAPMQEILGNTIDPHLRASCGAVPTKSDLTRGGIPFGFILSPFAHDNEGGSSSSSSIASEPARCSSCGSFRNLYVSVEVKTGRWACNFCGSIEKSDDLVGAGGLDHKELRDAVVHFSEGTAPDTRPLTAAGRPPAVHVFVVDATVRARDFENCKSDVVEAAKALPPGDLVGLIAYDGVVRIYDLSYADAARAQVLSGADSPSSHQLNSLGESCSLVSEVSACLATFTSIVTSLKPPVRGGTRKRAKLRCLGPSVETAVAIAGGSQAASLSTRSSGGISPQGGIGHVIVCAGAEASAGPGAADDEGGRAYYALVAERARRLGVCVDVFCAAAVGVGAANLLGLTNGSGGKLVVHPSFGGAMRTDLINSTRRSIGSAGVFDARASSGVAVTRIIGPLVEPGTREECDAADEMPNLSISPSVEPSTGYTVAFELEDDAILGEYAYFQFTAAWTTLQGERLLRVSTVRLPATDNIANLLQAVDCDAAAVLLSKMYVSDVMGGAPIDSVKASVHERMQGIAKTFGDQVKVTVSGRVNVIPAQLTRLPYLAYHLLHGPLLGPILNHEDDYAAIRTLFLGCNVADSIRIMAPTLLACPMSDGENYTALPLEDMSLHSEKILMLDHHTHVFIWSGSKVCGKEYDGVRANAQQHAMHWATGRFPCPDVMLFDEGSSMARWLVCRLDPSHRDAAKGGGMMGAVRGFLTAQFVHTDDDSMGEWLSKLRLATA